MTDSPTVTREMVEEKRRAFAKTLRDFTLQKGRYHERAPELPASKLADCQLLPNRYALLDKLPQGGVMAEIGVDRGDFSEQILTRCKPDMLHLFDIDSTRLQNPAILGTIGRPGAKIAMHVGDSSSNLALMPDASFDMIYIDGDHTHAGVVKDINAALLKIKPSGALIFNDYAVWSPVGMFHCGVARAVHELCLAHPWKFRYMALQTMLYNDVMLVRE
jgi:predicted O-methyltransferase YrrM